MPWKGKPMPNRDRRHRRHALWLLVFCWLVLGIGACKHPASHLTDDPELEPLDLGADFELQGDDGKPFRLSSLRGRVVILFFGYTNCPDVCPSTLGRLARAYRLLEEGGVDSSLIKTVFISVDPERDTADVLDKYLDYFAVPVTGVTGPPEGVLKVAQDFRASFSRVESDSAAGYLMEHSTYLYLIDPLGRVRHLFSSQDSPARIADLAERLVNEGTCAPPTEKPKS